MLPAATASGTGRTPFVVGGLIKKPLVSSSAKCSLLSTPPSGINLHKMFGGPSNAAATLPQLRYTSSRTSNVAVRSVGVDPVAVADAVVSVPGGISLPFGFDLPQDSQWQLWLLGAVATFVVPLATGKLGPLGKLFDKFDAAVDTAESVAEMVDKVAEKVEEVADDIGNSLPPGALKDALEYVENLADQTEKAAEYADQFLEKVEEVGDKVEAFAESAIAKKPAATASSGSTVVVSQSQEVKAEM